MTVQELYDAVAQLGFETTLEDTNRFILAVNRCMSQINRIKPLTSSYTINHFPPQNLLKETLEPQAVNGEALIFIAEGAKAYYFECNGKGVAEISKFDENNNSWHLLKRIELNSDNRNFKQYKGFVLEGANQYLGKIKIEIAGNYLMYVRNAACYGSITSDLEQDIPIFGRYCVYDFSKLVDNFLSFKLMPIKDLVINDDYIIDDGKIIRIPLSINGVYEVGYERKVREINGDYNAVIDLDDELLPLLPLLVASYIWADDEPAKAEYYLSLYREMVSEIRYKLKNFDMVKYTNNGW